MKIIIAGDREWDDPFIVTTVLKGCYSQLKHSQEPLVVIEGGANGADAIAGRWADSMQKGLMGVIPKTYPANWKKWGRKAGPLRNQEMLVGEEPDYVFGFHNNISQSRGTRNMLNLSVAAGIPAYLIQSYEKDLL